MGNDVSNTYREILNAFMEVYKKRSGMRLTKDFFEKGSLAVSVGLSPALLGNYEGINGLGNKIAAMFDKAYSFWHTAIDVVSNPRTYEMLSYVVQKASNPQTLTPAEKIAAYALIHLAESFAQVALENIKSNIFYYLGCVGALTSVIYAGSQILDKAMEKAFSGKQANPKNLSKKEKEAIMTHAIFDYIQWESYGNEWKDLSKEYDKEISKLLKDEYSNHIIHMAIYYDSARELNKEIEKANKYFQKVYQEGLNKIPEVLKKFYKLKD